MEENRRKAIFDKLKGNVRLPQPSATVMEVIRLCSSEESSLHEIAELIQTDPALSAEIIRYANSAFLATGMQVASIQKATVKLGMKTVVNLALGFSLLADNRSGDCRSFDYPLFWRTSLAEALAARELSRSGSGFDPDELFICGLLAHMGSLCLATLFPEEYDEILIGQETTPAPRALELEKFDIDGGELTTELFLSWGLPAPYALAAGFHEDLDTTELGSGPTMDAAALLHLAHAIARMCQVGEIQPDLRQKVISTAEEYGIDLGNFEETFSAIVDSWHAYGRLFAIDTAEYIPPEGDQQ